jgi:hypothetical protein
MNAHTLGLQSLYTTHTVSLYNHTLLEVHNLMSALGT